MTRSAASMSLSSSSSASPPLSSPPPTHLTRFPFSHFGNNLLYPHFFPQINRSFSPLSDGRLVFAANAVIAVYSLLELCASIREILRGTTLMPESVQLWFDFAPDQVRLLSLLLGIDDRRKTGGSPPTWRCRRMWRGAVTARGLGGCSVGDPAASLCVQSYISVALGFAGFGFLALSAVVSSFRIASPSREPRVSRRYFPVRILKPSESTRQFTKCNVGHA